MAQIKINKKFTKTKLNYLPKEIFNFFFLAFTLLFTLSIISYDPSDPNFFKTGLGDTINNYIGIFGSYVSHVTFMIFGKTTYFITVLLIYSVLERYGLVSSRSTIFSYKYSLLLLLIITSLSIISDFILAGTGGYLGHISLHYLSNYIGAYGSVTASLLTLLYSLVYYFDISVLRTYNQFKKIFT
ncbi:MAG: DNA translocase FtsK 4TM domain-containing protein, partial [Gammaproteobacteria bacterium]|nr:DNA translocase FtsK 4TM domain-containing protein [Gammaproteobacteria bacterium]